jgi:hypothetical protein
VINLDWRYHRIGSKNFAASANGPYAPPQPLGTLAGLVCGETEDALDVLSDKLTMKN